MHEAGRVRRAVLFDLDDTLLVDEPDVDACFRRVTAEVDAGAGVAHGTAAASVRAAARAIWRASPLAPLAMELGFSSWEGLAADYVGGHEVVEPFRTWVPSFRQAAWAQGLAPFGTGGQSTDLAARYRRERRARYRLFPESRDVLAGLRADGWLLGIVTNGPPDLQHEKIALTDLAGDVDVVVVSGVVGSGKPNRAVFDHALGCLGVPPAAAVMVGDSLTRDMNGAQQLGMRTIWRPAAGREPEWQPAVASLTQVPALLETIW